MLVLSQMTVPVDQDLSVITPAHLRKGECLGILFEETGLLLQIACHIASKKDDE